ncbi:hypothetical protein QUC31_013105 [Theobroma cacao]
MPSIKICLVLVFLSIFSFTSLADPMFLYHFCSNVTTFPGNSLYISNTNNLFAYLSSNATGHDGFYKTTAGRNPNMVYGLYLCRGDVRPEICQDCINLATAGVAQRCPNQTWAIIWYDQCMLRYSNQSIFYSMAESPKKNMLYNRDVTEPERFNRLVATLMQDIATRASNASMGAKKFATKEETFTAFQTIYSLAQCTPDISRGDCYRCLQKAIADLPNCCSGKIGGLSLYPSCNVQYLVSLFYDRSNEPIAAPPPAPPVPPLVLPPPPPGKRGISSQRVIKIVVPTVSFLVFSTFCVLGWEARKKLIVRTMQSGKSKLRNMQSLHFDLSIVEAATDKFAEVNKIGVGGFGSVYKVWRHWKNGTPIELMDSTLQDSYVSNEVLRCIQIGLLCVQEDPSARPTMARVVLMLSSPSVTLPSPKKTAFFFGTITGRKFSEQQSDRSKSTSSSASVNEASITEPFPRFTSLADSDYLYHFCSNVTIFTGNSVYITNINNLFSYLTSNATVLDGFYKTTSGQNPNMVHGLFLCRGDVLPEICQDCIKLAATDVAQRCPNQTGAIIWYDKCMLRYSNQSIAYSTPERPKVNVWYDNYATEPDRFNRLVATLMQDIATRASNASLGAKKFATKEAPFTGFQTIYSLAQCTPDISSRDCYGCLQGAIADLPNCCRGKTEAFALYPSCTVQYQVAPFYSRSNETIPPPPPASPALSLVHPPPPSGKTGMSSQRVIKIVAPTVSFLVFSSFCVLGWKARKKLSARKRRYGKSKARNMQSLHFDLSTVEAATNNFAEVNKIGEGGFGSVYKVRNEAYHDNRVEFINFHDN